MNSSTNPPTKLFDFGTDFEVEEERMRLEMLRQEELLRLADINAPPPLVHTENEMEAAKAEAFQRGVQHGLDEAKKGLESVLVDLIDRALQSVHVLLQNETARMHGMQETALRTTMASLKKFWPELLKNGGMAVCEKVLRETISTYPDETRIVIRVHDSLLDAVIQRLPQIKEQEAFNGKVIVIAESTLLPGDCKVEWADGGLEMLGRDLAQRLDDAMTRIVATLHLTSENSETERTNP